MHVSVSFSNVSWDDEMQTTLVPRSHNSAGLGERGRLNVCKRLSADRLGEAPQILDAPIHDVF